MKVVIKVADRIKGYQRRLVWTRERIKINLWGCKHQAHEGFFAVEARWIRDRNKREAGRRHSYMASGSDWHKPRGYQMHAGRVSLGNCENSSALHVLVGGVLLWLGLFYPLVGIVCGGGFRNDHE